MMGKKFASVFMLGAALTMSLMVLPVFAGVPTTDFAAFDRYFRTELYFGTDIPNGGQVTADQWVNFLSDEVTPRFPDGLTVVDAAGRFRSASGTIVKEKSRMIVLLYRKKDRETASRKIDEMRAVYCKLFKQESVMRVDFRRSLEVAFE